jgi:hypothetical protein
VSLTASAELAVRKFEGGVRVGDPPQLPAAFQRDRRGEPTLQGNTIPGFGDTRHSHRQVMTLNETHVFGSNLVNEARFGFNRIDITFEPNLKVNPTDLGINIGVTSAIGPLRLR